jgi:hypothetical protein
MTAHVDPTGQHAVYSPSSGKRWAKEDGCTASATAIAALGPREEGEEAKKGTEAHNELERCLGPLNGEFVDPATMPINPVDETHPSAYGVALMLSYIRQLPPGRMWVEQRVHLTAEIWGRVDIQHWHEETATLTIPDLKDGFVGVEPTDEQVLIYGAASALTHTLPVQWLRTVIVQPNDFRPGPRVKQHVTSADDLAKFSKRVSAIPHGPLTFKAGEHCTYCPLFGRCEATRDILAHLSGMLANPPDAVSPDQAAIFMACKKPIEDWFKSLDKALTKKALGGATIPGMKLVQTVKHRAWKDPKAARDEVVRVLGVDAFEPPTPAQAEKLGMDKTWVEALSERPDGGPALAFESDKRPTFARKSAAEMFAGVTTARNP